MIILPHLTVLKDLKARIDLLRRRPDHLTFLLDGYNSDALEGVFGAKYVDQAIEWLEKNDFQYVTGYRLDSAKLPNIAVVYEGGKETEQFLGDYGSMRYQAIEPKEYARFKIGYLDDNGNPTVSSRLQLDTKIWRSLVMTNGTVSRIIKGFDKTDSRVMTILLDEALPEDAALHEWRVVSSVNQKNYVIGSSMDSVAIKVYLTVAGDPELCEMLSTIVRYCLKQSRLALANSGLENSTFHHGALARSADHDEQNIWVMEFMIRGSLIDQWIISESQAPDRHSLEVSASSEGSESVIISSS